MHANPSAFNNADEERTLIINCVSLESKEASEASNHRNSIIPESSPPLNDVLDATSQIGDTMKHMYENIWGGK